MKPRSSSAVISRWMPDFERRSSASFISSKEGGTPSRATRLWMKSSSSNCLRVSMCLFSFAQTPCRSGMVLPAFPFCVNDFPGGERSERDILHLGAGVAGGVVHRPDEQRVRLGQDRQQRAVLPVEGRDGDAAAILAETGPH